MLQLLRAFAWLRWRILLNSFDRTSARDAVERFSLAIDQLGPIMAGILIVPTALVLGVGSALTAHALAAGRGEANVFQLVRFALLLIAVLTIVGPLILPGGDRTNPVRMLLLPIPRATLYVAQAAGALADPWVLLALPVLAGVPIGFAVAGAWTAALIAAAAGVLLAIVLTGLSTLSSSLMHLVSRDRRRGELLALLFVVVIPVIALLPTMFASGGEKGRLSWQAGRAPDWLGPTLERVFGILPTEQYAAAARIAATEGIAATVIPLLGLAVALLVLHAAGMAVYGRLLDSPAASGARRGGRMNELWTRRLPLLSPAASAVALGHVRLALRTPRGRAVLLTPLLMFGVFTAFMYRGGGVVEFGSLSFGSGVSMAAFVAGMSLLSVLPIAMNQFAVDGAGLTLVLLSPVSTRDYLAGKAAGNGIVAGIPTAVVMAVSLLLFPTGSMWLWMALGLGLLATWISVAPVTAIVSAIFPRAVDLNAVGRGSNAHGAAGLLGMAAFTVAGAPGILLTVAAISVLERPALAPALLLGWTLVTIVLNRVLSGAAERVFRSRRENLATLVG